MIIHKFAAAVSAAVNAHDPAAIAALWAEPADYLSPLTGHQQGLDALCDREEALFAGFSDIRATITAFGQNGPTGAMLVRFEGTHDGPYAGFPASGRPVTFEMVAIVTFDDAGKAIGECVFLNGDDIAQALAG